VRSGDESNEGAKRRDVLQRSEGYDGKRVRGLGLERKKERLRQRIHDGNIGCYARAVLETAAGGQELPMTRAFTMVLLGCSTLYLGCSNGGGGNDAGPDSSGMDSSSMDSSTPVNGCTTFTDDTATAATITGPTNSNPSQYSPNCVHIKAGQSVTWNADFTAHPLQAFGGTTPSPITVTSSGTTVSFTFPNAGTYGFQCQVHPSLMQGAIEVTP